MNPTAIASQDARQKLIVALDVSASEAALRLASPLRRRVGLFKVGLELFSSGGPNLVRALADEGDRVFLDLKLHDIPNTVRSAARSISRLGISMLTVHASGGVGMMRAAAEGAREGASGGEAPVVLGVTALTSLGNDDLAEIGWSRSSETVVLRLAKLAQSAGLDGVVASPHEAAIIRQDCGRGFLIVTPGIRPSAADRDDQARAATPRAAVEAGADFLVVGRPITQSADPAGAADAIVEEMKQAFSSRNPEAVHG